MKRLFEVVATILAGAGALGTLLGLLMVAYGLFGHKSPPPSLNEGHALSFFLGIEVGLVGLVSLLIGLGVRAGLRNKVESHISDEKKT